MILDALTALLILAGVTAWLATLGRQAMPKRERLPLSHWGTRELLSNVAIGYRQLVSVNRRMQRSADGARDGRRRQ